MGNTDSGNKNKKFWKGKKIIVILISLIIFFMVLIATILTISFLRTDRFKSGEGGTEEVDDNVDVSIGNKLEGCIQEKTISKKCALLFRNSGLEEKCEGMEEEDKCLYKIAIVKNRHDLCDKIEDKELRSECELENEVIDDEI